MSSADQLLPQAYNELRKRAAAQMWKDTDLDPLRERDDFKKLIAELEKKFAAERTGEMTP